MADVQLEHGHLRIANDLWEAWTRANLTMSEYRVLMAVVRLSYGWGRTSTAARRGDGPQPASVSILRSLTGLDAKGVRRGLVGLCMKQVIRQTGEHDSAAGRAATYAPEKDFDRWSPGVLPGTWEPSEEAPAPPMGTVPPPHGHGAPSPVGNLPPPPMGTVPPLKNKGENQEEEEEERTRKGLVDRSENRRHTVGSLWQLLGKRSGRERGALSMPDSLNADYLLSILDHSTDAEIDDRLRLCRGKGSPLSYFVALFDDDGRPKPLRGESATSATPSNNAASGAVGATLLEKARKKGLV